MASSSGQNGSRKNTNSQKKTTSSTSRSHNSNGKRKSNSGRSNSSGAKRSNKVNEPDFSFVDEIVLIIAFAIVIFLFLCTVGIIKAGEGADPNLGDYIKYFMLGVFGFAAYIVPIVTFFAMALSISNRNNYFVWFKIGSLIALVMIVGVLMHMIS